nr:hypothetical protein [Deltaproteobacteria bacterium]
MRRLSLPLFRVFVAGAWVVAAGCSDTTTAADSGLPDVDIVADAAPSADVPGEPCAPQNDPDGDGISTRYEGSGDADGDGVANSSDADSDNDGVPDRFEGGHGQAFRCDAPPDDNDNDGTPDFLDTDANGDGIRDALQVAPSPAQPGAGAAPALDCYRASDRGVNRDAANGWSCHPFDTDGDNVPDYADADADGDRISNSAEIAPGTAAAPTDTDMDGVPDWRDRDSDGDTVTDSQEGTNDRDGDMLPNYRDLDSDGDSPMGSEQGTDAAEAGDNDLATGANECPRELDVRTLDLARPMPDGIPDYLDTDSDNDGLGDREESVAGTDRCNPDSDNDGQLDSAEVAWCRNHMRERCATEASTRIPSTDYYLILPWMGAQVARELEFGSNLRVADVYFISDTTGSMGGVLRNVQSSIATPRTGLIDSITALIPDTWFGVNHYDDFPTGSFGGGSDQRSGPCSEPQRPVHRQLGHRDAARVARHGRAGDGQRDPAGQRRRRAGVAGRGALPDHRGRRALRPLQPDGVHRRHRPRAVLGRPSQLRRRHLRPPLLPRRGAAHRDPFHGRGFPQRGARPGGAHGALRPPLHGHLSGAAQHQRRHQRLQRPLRAHHQPQRLVR